MEKYQELWDKSLLFLKNEMDPTTYDELFANVKKIVKVENNYIYMCVKNAFIKYRIENFFQTMLNDFSKSITNPPLAFKFITEIEAEKFKNEQNVNNEQPKIVSTHRVLSPLYTFNSFEVGESNRFAFLTALKVAENIEKVYNPLYIFGDVGLGKTHLMSAIGNYMLDRDINTNVVYTTSQKFAEDYFLATRDKSGEKILEFYNKYNSADILLVDDIQFLENKQATQEEFFKIFDNLITNNKQVVVTSDKPANELKNVMSRLKSRFNWGVTADIRQPDINLRVNVLKNKLSTMIPDSDKVPDDVLNLLANHFQDNIRDLEGALRTFVNYCEFMKVPYNESSFYSALDNVLPKRVINEDSNVKKVTTVKEIVAKYFNITIDDLDSPTRKKNLVYARHIFMYILKNHCEVPMQTIGESLGNRDRTTVLHGIEKITTDIKTNQMIKNDVDIIISKLNK